MKENKYDDLPFFQKYSQMDRSQIGLTGAGEWHELKKLFPDFLGKTVLYLDCGYLFVATHQKNGEIHPSKKQDDYFSVPAHNLLFLHDFTVYFFLTVYGICRDYFPFYIQIIQRSFREWNPVPQELYFPSDMH